MSSVILNYYDNIIQTRNIDSFFPDISRPRKFEMFQVGFSLMVD